MEEDEVASQGFVKFEKLIQELNNFEWEGKVSSSVEKETFTIIKKIEKLSVLETTPEELLQFKTEHKILKKLLYRNKNQHRGTKFYQLTKLVHKRLFAPELINKLCEILKKFQDVFKIEKATRTLHFYSKQSSAIFLSQLKKISSSLEYLLKIHTQAAFFLQAEIVATFFLPFTLTCFGIIGFFHQLISNVNHVVIKWIKVLNKYCVAVEQIVNPKIENNVKNKETQKSPLEIALLLNKKRPENKIEEEQFGIIPAVKNANKSEQLKKVVEIGKSEVTIKKRLPKNVIKDKVEKASPVQAEQIKNSLKKAKKDQKKVKKQVDMKSVDDFLSIPEEKTDNDFLSIPKLGSPAQKKKQNESPKNIKKAPENQVIKPVQMDNIFNSLLGKTPKPEPTVSLKKIKKKKNKK